jgi:drug/metabolite transporter (DMT)-like permease
MAFALFGETLSLIQLAGMVLAATGVAVASRN